jgi:hypothetical protein
MLVQMTIEMLILWWSGVKVGDALCAKRANQFPKTVSRN